MTDCPIIKMYHDFPVLDLPQTLRPLILKFFPLGMKSFSFSRAEVG